MINFRYHLVSLVAVFLALAIGIVAGSTVIKESILDQTQQNLDNASKNLKELENTNADLRRAVDQLKARDDALDPANAAQLLGDRLTGMQVLVMKVDGVDDPSASRLRAAVAGAGADVAGVVTFTERLALAAPVDVARLQGLLGTSTLDPTALRAELAGRLALVLTGVADSRPARLGGGTSLQSTTTTTSTTAVDATTTPPSASLSASIRLRQFLSDLDGAGFVKFTDKPDDAATRDLGGLRLALISGSGAKLDNAAFVYPLLRRLGDGVGPATVAIEATPDGSTVERGSFVGPIRDDGSLRDKVSTVDDAEWFVGWAASVMALQALDRGTVGHYGVGKGADQLLPSPSP